MAKQPYKTDIDTLITQLQTELGETPAYTAPVQKVVPVKESVTKDDKPLNVKLHKELIKRWKVYASETDQTLKEITTAALEQYLSNHKK
jgi:hypothetical protein